MLKKIKYTLSFVLVLLISSSCQYEKRDINEDQTELRIVSLVPSYTKEIIYLGMKDHIVGATSYCDISKENKNLIVGSAVEINEEKILLLKPDVVFASGLIKEKSIQILKQNGINVQFLGKKASFDDLCEQFVQLGKIIGKEKEAQQYVNQANKRVDSLKALVPEQEIKPKVFFQLGANPIAAVIPNSFMDDYISFASCVNIFHDLDKIIVNRESILLRDPDYIIISSMGNVGLQEKEIWESYKDLSATKNGQIFIVKSATMPTIFDFVDNFEFIIKQLYGDN